MESFQGNAVINYTEREIPYTRIIEHKFFNLKENNVTYITKEYPKNFKENDEPFYPVNDEKNSNLYNKYFDMDDVIQNTFDLYNKNK